jgi:hypothetical protein
MAQNMLKALALVASIQAAIPQAQMDALIQASKTAGKWKPDAAPKLSDAEKAQKERAEGNLLAELRSVAFTLATHTDADGNRDTATREHMDAALGLAAANGGNQNTLAMYGSTFGKWLAATARKDSPADPAKLAPDVEKPLSYRDIRTEAATPDENARADKLARIATLSKELNADELDAVLGEYEQRALDRIAARKAKAEAKKAGKVGQTSQASTGPTSRSDGDDAPAADADDATDTGDTVADAARIAAQSEQRNQPRRAGAGRN